MGEPFTTTIMGNQWPGFISWFWRQDGFGLFISGMRRRAHMMSGDSTGS